MLVTRPACFSPFPAVAALGIPPAEGGVAEPKSGGDEPASHSSGSPRNHRRIHLHYPPPAPPYPAVLRAGSQRSRCRQRVLRARSWCRAVPRQLRSLRRSARARHSALFPFLHFSGWPQHRSCGGKSSNPFPRGPQPCLRGCSPARGRPLWVCRQSLLCMPLVRNLSSFHSLTVCS